MKRSFVALTLSAVLAPLALRAESTPPPAPAPAENAPAAPKPVLSAKAAAARIDAALAEAWKKDGVKANAPVSDETWVRRVYLDAIGRIPTADEIEAFVADKAPDKRSVLIDRLLDSEGYVSHFYNFWADLLRVNTETVPGGGRLSQEMYARWIRQCLRENKPYDQFVRELLTTQGPIWKSGAPGYYLRDPGMPLDNLSNTVQVFLGTRIVCAQCHDHPFDKWKQLDYYKLAAFTYGVESASTNEFVNRTREWLRATGREEVLAKTKDLPKGETPAEKKAARETEQQIRREIDKEVSKKERSLQQAFQPLQDYMRASGVKASAKYPRLPKDYHYPNAKPNQEIHPEVPFGPSVSLGEKESPLEPFGEWVTSPENPRFTTVIANRLWKKVFGLGLVEPVDEFMDDTRASHPKVMTVLEESMKEMRYDMRGFVRALMNTDLYTREASHSEVDPGSRYVFTGPVLRRMSAEQAWDSFVTLVRPDGERSDPRRDARSDAELERARKISEGLEALPPEKMLEISDRLQKLQSENGDTLKKLRVDLDAARTSGDKALAGKIGSEIGKLRTSLQKEALKAVGEATGMTFPEPDDAAKAAMAGMMDAAAPEEPAEAKPDAPLSKEEKLALQKEREKRRDKREWVKRIADFRRACYLSSPAPRGHFLREFGQSDRDTIDNASDEATVPQALNLLNGPMVSILTANHSVLSQKVMAEATPEAKISAAFLSLLGRKPTADEQKELAEMIHQQGESSALRDLVHALINTREFIYIQ